jgi:hypothetical protein
MDKSKMNKLMSVIRWTDQDDHMNQMHVSIVLFDLQSQGESAVYVLWNTCCAFAASLADSSS